MSDPVLVLQNLTVGYKKRRGPETAVLTGVSLQLYPGELVCLIGPNGAGKSTLLRSTAGLQQVLKGSVLCNNEDIFRLDEKDRARRISVVLTERVDAGMITVFSLVSLGRYPYTSFSGKLGKQDVAAVYKALEDVGGSDLIHRPVNTLSDGERQKIMIGDLTHKVDHQQAEIERLEREVQRACTVANERIAAKDAEIERLRQQRDEREGVAKKLYRMFLAEMTEYTQATLPAEHPWLEEK